MTLADFFLAVNNAEIRLANVGGQLQLRGPTNAVTDCPEHQAAHGPASNKDGSGVRAGPLYESRVQARWRQRRDG